MRQQSMSPVHVIFPSYINWRIEGSGIIYIGLFFLQFAAVYILFIYSFLKVYELRLLKLKFCAFCLLVGMGI